MTICLTSNNWWYENQCALEASLNNANFPFQFMLILHNLTSPPSALGECSTCNGWSEERHLWSGPGQGCLLSPASSRTSNPKWHCLWWQSRSVLLGGLWKWSNSDELSPPELLEATRHIFKRKWWVKHHLVKSMVPNYLWGYSSVD